MDKLLEKASDKINPANLLKNDIDSIKNEIE